MFRLQPNRCGYQGNKCVGLDQLIDMLGELKMVSDTMMDRVVYEAPYFDNYYNLPVRVEKEVIYVDSIKDLRGKNIVTVGTDICDTADDGNFVDALGKLSDIIDGAIDPLDPSYKLLATNLLCASSDDTNGIFKPGIIPLTPSYSDPEIPEVAEDPTQSILEEITGGIEEIETTVSTVIENINNVINQTNLFAGFAVCIDNKITEITNDITEIETTVSTIIENINNVINQTNLFAGFAVCIDNKITDLNTEIDKIRNTIKPMKVITDQLADLGPGVVFSDGNGGFYTRPTAQC